MQTRLKKERRRDILLFVTALFLLIFISIGLWQTRPQTSSEKEVAQIVEEPQNYYGNEVTLSADVSSILGSRAFTVAGSGLTGSTLLVVSKQPIEPIGGAGLDSLFHPGDKVTIKGHVASFSLTNIEKELNVDLVDSIYLPWQGRPVIVADTVSQKK